MVPGWALTGCGILGRLPALSGLRLPGLSATQSGRRSHMVTKNKGNRVDRNSLNLSLLCLVSVPHTHSRPKWAGVFCVCLRLPPSSLTFQLGVCSLGAR